MTLQDVANRASVSVSTASKALKGSYDVSEETRRRVMAAAHELGYFRKKKQLTLTNHLPGGWCIAILSPEIASPYYNTITQKLTQAAKEQGCQVLFFETGFDKNTVHTIARTCVDDPRINAIISFSQIQEELATDTVPIITMCPSRRFTQIETLLDDALTAIQAAYPASVSVAVVGEQLTAQRHQIIRRYFPHATILSGCDRYDVAGQQAADKLLAMPALPRLVFCTYDEIAYGLIDRLTQKGIRIPEDIEIIGINDSYSSQWVHGGLSTIAFDYGDVFQDVIRDITRDLQYLGFHVRYYQVHSRFVRRKTTK